MVNQQSDTAVNLITFADVRQHYRAAVRRFYRRQKLLSICRSHCKLGGKWPRMTRNAREEFFQAAREARRWQQLYRYLKDKRDAAMPA